ncbi:hypothetical protein C6H66_13895 [Photorhabdus hindustanensis]|uniref:Uncharacterized protein n=2 Tax=Photorhabdus TaxID=29487 RepID=A0A2S8Q036_9GAMM|nr:hypothetical protein [Photorhabdus hainanensis]OCA54546.1 hypothetical protein Phpb_02457 [Photorhabdus namnaonensis]PQQ24952.1 hypothetical protein C6H66_13895 [Photorhabdus hindustanensis]
MVNLYIQNTPLDRSKQLKMTHKISMDFVSLIDKIYYLNVRFVYTHNDEAHAKNIDAILQFHSTNTVHENLAVVIKLLKDEV